jgi:hypothetical protein
MEFPIRGRLAKFSVSNRPKRSPTEAVFARADTIGTGSPDDTAVLLVTGAGEHKAYPLRWLDSEEVVLDTLADQVLLVTYCGLTHSPVVYVSSPDVKVHDVEDSGYIYESNLVLRDRRTGSLWQQMSGDCLTGPMAGEELRRYPSFVALLGAVKREIPGTLVMLEPSSDRNRTNSPPLLPNGLPANLSPYPIFSVSSFEPKLPTKERVIGFLMNGAEVALPTSHLLPEPQAHTIGAIKFRTLPYLGSHRVEVCSNDGNWTRVDTQLCFWFAWYLMHPNSHVLNLDSIADEPSQMSRL